MLLIKKMNTFILQNRYTDQAVVHAINIIRFPKEHNPSLYIPSLKYILNYKNRARQIFKDSELFSCCRVIFDLCYSSHRQIARDLADFLFHTYQNDSLINRMRDLEQERKTARKAVKNTIYADSQNVHNSKINASVIESAYHICSKYIIDDVSLYLENIKTILISKFPTQTQLIKSSLDYISINTSYFVFNKENGTPTVQITLLKLFVCVWLWILESPHREELEKRLMEELKQMNGQCSTGHLARLVNVIQGFTEDEKLCIKISEKDRMNSIIRNFLTKELEKCTDENVIDGLLNKNIQYQEYIRKLILSKLNKDWVEWKKEDVFEIVNTFSEIKIFN